MTTQSKVSNPIEAAPVRQLSWPLALVILGLGVILGILASNMTTLAGKAEVADVPEHVGQNFSARPNMLNLERQAMVASETRERAMQAETDRYTSLGLFYAVGDEQPGIAAEIARYEGLAEFYGANTQRAIAAEAARYKGLSEFYGVKENALAWPPRPTQFHPIENAVTCGPVSSLFCNRSLTQFHPIENAVTRLDESALAVYHQSEWAYTPIKANADGDRGLMEFFAAKNGVVVSADGNALAVYHQSERAFVPIVTGHDREYGLARFGSIENETSTPAWPPRPTQFHPIENAVTRLDENALAAYHQSEWGRPAQVIETGADGDIGLMEFFTPEE